MMKENTGSHCRLCGGNGNDFCVGIVACGDGYSGPVVADSIFVAEVSKQDICVPQNVGEAAAPCASAFIYGAHPPNPLDGALRY